MPAPRLILEWLARIEPRFDMYQPEYGDGNLCDLTEDEITPVEGLA